MINIGVIQGSDENDVLGYICYFDSKVYRVGSNINDLVTAVINKVSDPMSSYYGHYIVSNSKLIKQYKDLAEWMNNEPELFI